MKLSRSKVKRAVNAHARGWTNRKIAVDVFNATERTLYNWIAHGREIFTRVTTVEIREDELSPTELLKMQLFEGMKASTNNETLTQTLERLENRIHEIEFEKEEKEEKAEANALRRTQRIQSWIKTRDELREWVKAFKEAKRNSRECNLSGRRVEYYLSRR